MILEKSDVSLYYEIRGEGEALILIHGMIVDAGLYERAAQILAEKYRVLTFDRRGNSRSRLKGNLVPAYSMDAQAQDIKDLMDATGTEKAYIAGASAGAVIGHYFLQKYPERVKHLIMYEPSMLGLMITKDPETAEWYAMIKSFVDKGKINNALLRFAESIGEADDRSPVKSQEMAIREMDNVEFAFKNEMPGAAVYIPDLESFKKYSDKITIAAGERSRGNRYEKQAIYLSGLMGKKPVYYPGGHNLPFELPKEYAICIYGTLALKFQ
ncbi:MAG: alpha/beta hydrolase [Lachnospiraceae bacterium]|nr:alpha/beta hydrolase [Lachnospiraceae bacterium]